MAVDKTFLDVDVLNFHEDQLHVYAIVTHHLEVTLHGKDAEQLFMILTGEGGTGKLNCMSYMPSLNTLNLKMQWIY